MDPRNRKAPLLSELYKMGLPTIEFRKTGAVFTAHTSGHSPIHKHTVRDFGCLDEFYPDADFGAPFECSSSVLGLNNIRSARKIIFDNESTINFTVSLFLEDIISLLQLVGHLHIVQECSVTNETGSQHRSHEADFWIVYLDGRPILVVQVKSPLSGFAADDDGNLQLNNPKVVGQLYDYLRNVQDFFGATHVFGIVTTFKHWKFVWYPHSDGLAESTTLPVPDPMLHDTASVSNSSRDVCASRIYRQDEESLPRLVMSLVRKAQSTSFQPVSLLTTRRMYVNLLPQSWQWLRPTEAVVDTWSDNLTLQIASQPSTTAQYIVLKHFQGGSALKVWFTMIHNTKLLGTMCIVKQKTNMEGAAREVELWHRVNRVTTAVVREVSEMPAVIVPFVVLAHAAEPSEDGSFHVEFNFDAATWGLHNNVVPGTIPVKLVALAASIRDIATGSGMLNVRDVALAAIARAAEQGVLHGDLEWRHIALVPEFDPSGAVVRLLPGLIDFEHASDAVPEQALAEMTARINDISHNATFFT